MSHHHKHLGLEDEINWTRITNMVFLRCQFIFFKLNDVVMKSCVGNHTLVQTSWNTPGKQILFYCCWYLEHWLYFCRNGKIWSLIFYRFCSIDYRLNVVKLSTTLQREFYSLKIIIALLHTCLPVKFCWNYRFIRRPCFLGTLRSTNCSEYSGL